MYFHSQCCVLGNSLENKTFSLLFEAQCAIVMEIVLF